jgi:diacylglycerol kinase family enzyme
MMARRLWASGGLLLLAGSLVVACVVAITAFPRGLSVLVCLAVAALAAWYAVRRRGFVRALLAVVAAAFALGAVAFTVFQGSLVGNLVVIAAFVAALACVRAAFKVHVELPAAQAPARPVLFYNPRSGGGKAERFKLPEEARRRGIEPVELRPGEDLEELVRDAVKRGAGGLAMAGGDGSQAIVAMIAAEHDLPYACIPAGTRNHFALDLGVDRDDVVGALDAFVNGGERRVDLAEVNGRVFVNNVSLGLYAEAVQRAGYREAKIRTLLNTVPDVLGPDAQPPDLTWTEGDGHHSGAAILVSNNAYRLGRAIDNATRPRLDQGQLGITVIGDSDENSPRHRGAALSWHQWSSRAFELDSPGPVPAGIDGEATMLEPPLRFHTRPGALRVRIAPSHPGASPSALEPDTASGTIVALVRLAVAGRLDALEDHRR